MSYNSVYSQCFMKQRIYIFLTIPFLCISHNNTRNNLFAGNKVWKYNIDAFWCYHGSFSQVKISEESLESFFVKQHINLLKECFVEESAHMKIFYEMKPFRSLLDAWRTKENFLPRPPCHWKFHHEQESNIRTYSRLSLVFKLHSDRKATQKIHS